MSAVDINEVQEIVIERHYASNAILPSQWNDMQKMATSPELRLMWAVMEDAIGQYYRNKAVLGRRANRIMKEIETWINSNESLWLYSFIVICETFNIDPDYLRKGIFQHQDFPNIHRTTVGRRLTQSRVGIDS